MHSLFIRNETGMNSQWNYYEFPMNSLRIYLYSIVSFSIASYRFESYRIGSSYDIVWYHTASSQIQLLSKYFYKLSYIKRASRSLAKTGFF